MRRNRSHIVAVWAARRGRRLADSHHRDGGVVEAGQIISGWDFRLDGGTRPRRRRRAAVCHRHCLCSGSGMVLRAEQVLLLEARLGQERLQRGQR